MSKAPTNQQLTALPLTSTQPVKSGSYTAKEQGISVNEGNLQSKENVSTHNQQDSWGPHQVGELAPLQIA